MITGPTYLTMLRMLLAITFSIFAMFPYNWAKIIALIIFIVATLTDKIDGIWARRKKLVTDLGAFLDPLADKMLVNLAFLILVYQNIIPLWVFAIIIVRDLAVDGMRMMAARSRITIAASFYGKLKTTAQMLAIAIFLINAIFLNDTIGVIANVTLYLSLALTIFSGLDYLVKGYKKVIRSKKPPCHSEPPTNISRHNIHLFLITISFESLTLKRRFKKLSYKSPISANGPHNRYIQSESRFPRIDIKTATIAVAIASPIIVPSQVLFLEIFGKGLDFLKTLPPNTLPERYAKMSYPGTPKIIYQKCCTSIFAINTAPPTNKIISTIANHKR